MKSFRFSLEQVRLWRAEQAELEELQLQKINAELRGLNHLARQVQAEADQAARGVLSLTRVAADDLSNLDGFRGFTRNRLNQIAQQTLECEARADRQRQRVVEARRQFELLDRLRKNAAAEWRRAGDKEQEDLAAEGFLAKRTRDRD